ncbi:hypothetical protein G6O69_08120 [Pseudenhygromyxa sp. WMMC2535]|uniref:hypothetical protein n=1 Tax=Pseudenhygromyxa sp. WMMC2535 TaxID=2712867 RepID=UPI001555E436|nr:hypothetical protein [Pseudenhygromyxa sp. WMMC2535]NVB37796.1 hypothetical protein [Pseudenhygromyxa sp. WMMC2535]
MRFAPALLFPALFSAAVVFGCASDPEHFEFEDIGEACVVAKDESHTIEAVVDGCASPCAENMEVGCEVSVEGEVIEISTWLRYDLDQQQDCIESCLIVEASCEVPALEDGVYTVRMGDAEAELAVPDAGEEVCVEV